MSKCAILGAGGHGKVVAEIAELNGYKEICFFDDRWPELSTLEDWKVVGDFESLLGTCLDFEAVFVAIGHNKTRVKKQVMLSEKGASLPVLVHPKATLSKYSQIGEGTVVMAGAIINPYSSLGPSCIINTSATIDHDCVLERGVHISPGANLAGGVFVGTGSWVGISACVKQYVSIGCNTIVAAGAVVINNVLDEQIVVGVPAQPLIDKD
ncbi:acetyltransferase [Vibrio coralliilyticus]|uniref:acetyltransferase n=1 Tax=Vibrio coralliilyticus TaxID=190893 RepID=UPI001851B375|nr:acetyltransferase [Vibrio coralliilyticus]NUW68967.1 acetyltransferase [Vibrio coralliilyticus]